MGLRERLPAIFTRAAPDVEVLERSDQSVGGRRGTGGIYMGGLGGGGIQNNVTGMGTGLDKSTASFFSPTFFYWQAPLEILCVQSWAARNFVDFPVDDQFIRWRMWSGEQADDNETMEKAELKHKLTNKLSKAMKAARQFGTGALIIMSREAPLTAPLVPEQVREGDLANLLVLNRYEMQVEEEDRDLMSPTYGEPLMYQLFPNFGSNGSMVHASRVVRFEGISAPSDGGFSVYDRHWGQSELLPVILSILEDQTLATGIAHLSQEASISVLKISQLREAIAGHLAADDPDAPDINQIASTFNQYKSIYRVAVTDKDEEEFDRVSVQFGGLADLIDVFNERLAAAAKIPLTRWKGMSPAGLSSTGESDMKNYVLMVEARRAEQLPVKLDMLDQVLARDAGLEEPPDYKWLSLLELSEVEQTAAAKARVETIGMAVDKRLIDEDEARDILKEHEEMFSDLQGDAPEPEDPFADMGAGMFGGPPPGPPGMKPAGPGKPPQPGPPKPGDKPNDKGGGKGGHP